MSDNWQEEYRKLSEFVAANPQLKMTGSSVSIPEDAKAEFWKLFDETRRAFIKERFPSLISDAEILSRNYMKAIQDVKDLLGLDEISMSTGQHRFLCNPRDMLARLLFNHLFDLLKDKIGINAFEKKGLNDLEAFSVDVYQHAYSKWVLLSLVQLLEADEGLSVPLGNLGYKEIMRQMQDGARNAYSTGAEVSLQKLEIPSLERLKKIDLSPEGVNNLTLPDFIIHSAKINRYVAIKTEFNVATSIAANTGVQREWLPIESVLPLASDIILVYTAGAASDIALTADAEKIYKPDLILTCKGQKDWYHTKNINRINVCHNNLKPKLGTYIVSNEPVSEEVYKELEKGINILYVGLEQSRLEPVTSALEPVKK